MLVKLDYLEKRNSCHIALSDSDVRERLMHAFSVPNKEKRFVSGANARFVPDRKYFITPTGTFNFGIAFEIIKWLKTYVLDRTVEYDLSDSFKEKFCQDDPGEIHDDLAFQLRDYQRDCVKLALTYKFGTFVLGTGAGKTFTIASIIHNLFINKNIKRVLIVVPDNGLVTQFYDELVNVYKLNHKIQKFYDKFNKIEDDSEIVIANRPLLLSRFDQYEKIWRTGFDCLIVDEAHSIKRENKVSKCIEKIVSKYRFGFTGTLAEDTEDMIKNIGLLGPVRYEKTSKELRDEGVLSNVIIRKANLVYPEYYGELKYRQEVEELYSNEYRNKFLSDLCFKLDKNTLLLVNRLEHGFILKENFDKINFNNKKIYFIRGEIDTDARDEIKKLMEQEDNILCIAITKIFSTGINIKNLHNIILAAGGKSSVTVVQSIGRGLRLHPTKKELNIFDICDKGFKYSTAHAEKRLKIYEKEKIKVTETNIILRT
ncbi:MAG: DEAD/DEAH box helicase family protein [Lachnospiraceae bacterium]|nr:DEAD/DEAH box helicase family protein [Lachnospiraceae bacterium]